jgi:long-chain fatty acid transport protein
MQHKKLGIVLTVLVSVMPPLAHSAGYAVLEQSVTGLGRAFSGSAAVAEDATTLFFNPAGLTYLKRNELVAGLHFIDPKSKFIDENSRTSDNVGGAALTGSGNVDGGKNAFVPNFYYAHKINNKVTSGIGITAPYGLVTEYNDNWQGRYHAITSDLKTVNFNPSIAFKTSEALSLGFGLNLQYIDLTLSQAVDFGSICAATVLAGACGTPQGYDGLAKLTADDWSWGYNLGLIYQLNDATRIAAAYRSKISHHLKGKGKFTLPDDANIATVASSGGFVNGNIDGKVDIPETLSVALHHEINSKWAVMADVTWTRWSRFQELVINSNDVERLNSSRDEKWKDVYRYGVGLTYQHDDKWTLRTGIAFDQSPISNTYRTARIPGQDRTWLAFGASYNYTKDIAMDVAYSHIFIDNPSINERLDPPLEHTLQGDYKSSVDIVSVQLRWKFD